MSVPPPLNVTSTGPASSPLPSPSFSLAPQRTASLRMTTPTHTPAAAATGTSEHASYPKSSPTGNTGGYSLRGGRSAVVSNRSELDDRIERDRGGDRHERSADRSDRNERSDRGDRSDRGGDRDRGGSSNRGGRDYKSGSGTGGSYRGGHSERGGNRADHEKKISAAQAYANSLPVVGLLETPPSPALPPAFHAEMPPPITAASGSIFSVLDEGESAASIDEELEPFPLSSPWTVYFDKKTAAGKGKAAAVPPKLQGGHADPLSSYESNLHTLHHFATVQEFWSLQNHLVPPSQLEQNSTLHFFKDGIKPVWEDENNKLGGKWIFRIAPKDKHLLDHCFQNILLAVIGGTMDDSPEGDEICGVVLSKRRMGDRIAVWNRHRDDTQTVIALGHRFRAALLEGLPMEHNPTIHLSYEDNEETIRLGYCAFGSNVRFNL